MDVQIHTLMPAAKPTPASGTTANYNYWKYYIDNNWDSLGYRSYLQHVMANGGRDGQPGSTLYTPISHFSSDCPYHTESTAGGSFSFPPREMPTHAARRAIIAALKVVKTATPISPTRTNAIGSRSSRSTPLTNGATIQVSLTSNYTTAMQACTDLQAVADADGSSTATEVGLDRGRQPHQAQQPGRIGPQFHQ